MNNLEIKNTNIGQIHGYERNARNHPESQIKQIRKSITEFGFNNPILIDEHGEIIAGHGSIGTTRCNYGNISPSRQRELIARIKVE